MGNNVSEAFEKRETLRLELNWSDNKCSRKMMNKLYRNALNKVADQTEELDKAIRKNLEALGYGE